MSPPIPLKINPLFYEKTLVYRPDDVYRLAGAEVVVTTAGKPTPGLARFFASRYGKPVPGRAFFPLSWVSTPERRAFPLRVEQVVRSDAEKAARKATADAQQQPPAPGKRRPGPPRRAARTNPQLTARAHRSDCAAQACSKPG